MARLGNILGRRIGTFTWRGSDPPSETTSVVALTREVIPFDTTLSARNGFSTEFAATTAAWSSRTITAVMRDDEDRYHAVETTVPRVRLDGVSSFVPNDDNGSPYVVKLVAVPIDVEGRHSSVDRNAQPCIVAANLAAAVRSTPAGYRLAQASKDVFRRWEVWWTRHVGGTIKNPPRPPAQLSRSFIEIAGVMFNLPQAEISVMQTKDELVADRLSLNLFDRTAVASAGVEDVHHLARIQQRNGPRIPVVLQLKAEAFQGARLRRLLSTGIHEGAHYRHHLLASELIERFRDNASSQSGSGRADRRLLEFFAFLDAETRQGRLTQVERTIVHSALRREQATHPLAQLHAFLGTYHLYPRERSAVQGRALTTHERFTELSVAAGYWSVLRPHIAGLSTRSVADFARRDGQCTIEDLTELTREIAASQNYPNKGYFAALAVELANPL